MVYTRISKVHVRREDNLYENIKRTVESIGIEKRIIFYKKNYHIKGDEEY